MSEVNDPKESNYSAALYGGDSIEGCKELLDRLIEFHQTRIKAACFSMDDPSIAIRGGEHIFHGWAKPTMWAHYAENHKGVCLAFKKQPLVRAFERQFAACPRLFHGNVNYQEYRAIREDYIETRHCLHKVHVQTKELQEDFNAAVLTYLDTNCEEMYFRKHGDWAGERESRLLFVSEDDGFELLDVTDSIAGVCSGFAMEGSMLADVKSACDDAGFMHMELNSGVFR